MTRTVQDAAVMLAALVGPDPRDPWTLGGAALAPVSSRLAGGDLTGLSVGYVRRMHNRLVDDDVQAATDEALKTLTALGAEVEEVTEAIDWIEYEGRVLYQTGIAALVAPLLDRWRDRLDPTLLAFAEWGMAFSMLDLRAANAARTRLYQAVQRLFDRFDVLVSPTTARPALPVDFKATDQVPINGEPCGITRQSWTAYQYPFNLTGHPAASVPSGWSRDGLPTALQIVGRWWADMDVLRVAAAFEQARPWAGRCPPAR
jgi:aspartyl-tRNA(Asn)/glutamyl-tRNA(Gln) amidotransferase subunit A